ncbi:hypothetical protein BC834DRAFT_149401 [Gloeopeniophorella convolvens]|nr:hypothetical protein BC834DRAFT_149401 [Gloeopeniophorella convolvens]
MTMKIRVLTPYMRMQALCSMHRWRRWRITNCGTLPNSPFILRLAWCPEFKPEIRHSSTTIRGQNVNNLCLVSTSTLILYFRPEFNALGRTRATCKDAGCQQQIWRGEAILVRGRPLPLVASGRGSTGLASSQGSPVVCLLYCSFRISLWHPPHQARNRSDTFTPVSLTSKRSAVPVL